jgi:hypothetical protein
LLFNNHSSRGRTEENSGKKNRNQPYFLSFSFLFFLFPSLPDWGSQPARRFNVFSLAKLDKSGCFFLSPILLPESSGFNPNFRPSNSLFCRLNEQQFN